MRLRKNASVAGTVTPAAYAPYAVAESFLVENLILASHVTYFFVKGVVSLKRLLKEAYFPKGMSLARRDRHPSECDCRRAEREKREAKERRAKHQTEVERAHSYVAQWETMKAENIGLLLWGKVGTGKSFFAGCIANTLMEQEISVRMTNFAAILNDLAASFEGRNEYISRR